MVYWAKGNLLLGTNLLCGVVQVVLETHHQQRGDNTLVIQGEPVTLCCTWRGQRSNTCTNIYSLLISPVVVY